MGVANLLRLKKTKRFLAANLTGVEFQLVYNVLKKVTLPFGEVVTNCTECKMTCHPNCGLTDNLYDCNVMDHSMEENIRTCRVCPKKCLWNVHANESFKWINENESQTVSLNLLKRNYDTTRDLTWQEFADQLEADIEETKREMAELIETSLIFAERVTAIDKNQDPKLTPLYCYAVFDIANILDRLVLSEEEIARRDQDVEWINKLKELLQSIDAMIAVPESIPVAHSDSSEENYGSSYNSEFDGSEEERDCSCSSSCDCSD